MDNKRQTLLLILVLSLGFCLAGCEKTIRNPSGLEHSNPHYRRNTAFWFGESGRADTVELMSKTLRTDTDVTVRAAAAKSLGQHGDPAAIGVLREALTDSYYLVRWYVVEALGVLLDAKVIAEIKSNSSKFADSFYLQLQATEVSAEVSKEIEMLLKQDKNGTVRQAAADTLGRLQSKDSLESLVAALQDPDSRVRYASMRSLQRITGLTQGKDPKSWQQWWSTVHE